MKSSVFSTAKVSLPAGALKAWGSSYATADAAAHPATSPCRLLRHRFRFRPVPRHPSPLGIRQQSPHQRHGVDNYLARAGQAPTVTVGLGLGTRRLELQMPAQSNAKSPSLSPWALCSVLPPRAGDVTLFQIFRRPALPSLPVLRGLCRADICCRPCVRNASNDREIGKPILLGTELITQAALPIQQRRRVGRRPCASRAAWVTRFIATPQLVSHSVSTEYPSSRQLRVLAYVPKAQEIISLNVWGDGETRDRLRVLFPSSHAGCLPWPMSSPVILNAYNVTCRRSL